MGGLGERREPTPRATVLVWRGGTADPPMSDSVL